jgi:alpha-1,2-mannosyltransferase
VSGRRLAARGLWLFACGFLPLVALFVALEPVVGDSQAADFHFAYYPAAEAVLEGEDFYPRGGFILRGETELVIDYVYPPLIALVATPLTVLPVASAEVVWVGLLLAAFLGTLWILGVRDWRCYGLAFLWPPVTDAVATGNVSILLGLAAALVWRLRDVPRAAGPILGISIAAKVFLWPLTVWLAATRRLAAAAWSIGVALGVLFASWAVVGFRGLSEYPDLVRRLSERMDERGYTVYALGVDLGLPASLAWALWLGVAVGLLAGTVVLARRGDDRRAFVLALAATLAFSPIVWLHYFALLLVAVAVVQPRLAPVWFIGLPLELVITTGVYNGSTFQTAAMLVAAALTFALVLMPPARGWATRLRAPVAARS